MTDAPLPPEAHATIDFETFSSAGYFWDGERYVSMHGSNKASDKGLSGIGSAVYAEHPSTEVLTLSYRLPGQPIQRWRPGQPLPQDLFDWTGPIEAHNVMFERQIWEHVCTPRYGFPPIAPARWRCSMAKARVNALPGALGNLTKVLQTAVVKDADGKRLLDKFSMPRKPTKTDPRFRIRPEEDPEDAEKLYRYCDVDVESEELASAAMPEMSPDELRFWQIDQEINHRGVGVDLDSVRNMRIVMEATLERYGQEFADITGGLSPSQVQATVGWLTAKGVQIASLDADAVDAALKDPNLPADARRVLEIRALTGSASVKKLYALEREATSDRRLKNLFVHHGGRTGRAAGNGPQPQNLPKAGPDLKWCDCGKPNGAHRMDCAWCGELLGPRVHEWSGDAVDAVQEVMATHSVDLVEEYFGPSLLAISGCIRGMFVAAPDHDLIASDFTAIEAVVAACLAGEQWRIDVFREGRPIYLESASKITGTPVAEYERYAAENGKHHPDRNKIGKVAELACLAPETEVLTDRGYIPIKLVSTDDQLWDGVQWVSHQGVVSRGVRRVIDLDGTRMTPDHKVLCGTSWLEASRPASNLDILHLALAKGSENLPSLGPPRIEVKARARGCYAHAGQNPTRWTTLAYDEGIAPAAINALSEKAGPPRVKTIGGTQIYAPTSHTAVDSSIESRLVSTGATTLKTEATLTTAGAAFRYTSLGAQVEEIFSRISSRLRDGMCRLLSWIGSKWTKGTNRATYASSQSLPTASTSGPSETYNPELTNWSDVYDIAHAGPRNRFTIRTNSGHVIVHNCGFGGWVGAFKAFAEDADEAETKKTILAWREASPAIVEMWGGQSRGKPWERRSECYGLEGIVVQAVQFPGAQFSYRGVTAYMAGDVLKIRLLSGRELTYQQPRLTPSTRREGEWAITFWTWNTNPKYGPTGWVPMSTYAGKLFENVVQATAHDLLRFAIVNLEAAGYPVVLHIHDEIVSEVPEGFGSVEEFEAIMSRRPEWAADWPVAVDGGYRAKRYKK